jgi:hypothetical protein
VVPVYIGTPALSLRPVQMKHFIFKTFTQQQKEERKKERKKKGKNKCRINRQTVPGKLLERERQ